MATPNNNRRTASSASSRRTAGAAAKPTSGKASAAENTDTSSVKPTSEVLEEVVAHLSDELERVKEHGRVLLDVAKGRAGETAERTAECVREKPLAAIGVAAAAGAFLALLLRRR